MSAVSGLKMADIAEKSPTRRSAVASGSLRMGREAFELLRDGRLPKGDALGQAEVAGLLAAKRTPEALPLCHPLPLDGVEIAFELDPALPGLRVRCRAWTVAKTGVEMEALSGATGALLAAYDAVKPVDPALTIETVRLELKEGGKSGLWRHPESSYSFPPVVAEGKDGGIKPLTSFRASIITVSDRCSRGEAEDRSGHALARGLAALGFAVSSPLIIPDDKDRIAEAIQRLARESDAVVLTGGTGLGPRDVTPEAVASACDRLIPGFGEILRADGARTTPLASLSRSTAGQLGRAIVVALPGSVGGVEDGLRVLARLLPHAVHVSRGGGH